MTYTLALVLGMTLSGGPIDADALPPAVYSVRVVAVASRADALFLPEGASLYLDGYLSGYLRGRSDPAAVGFR